MEMELDLPFDTSPQPLHLDLPFDNSPVGTIGEYPSNAVMMLWSFCKTQPVALQLWEGQIIDLNCYGSEFPDWSYPNFFPRVNPLYTGVHIIHHVPPPLSVHVSNYDGSGFFTDSDSEDEVP